MKRRIMLLLAIVALVTALSASQAVAQQLPNPTELANQAQNAARQAQSQAEAAAQQAQEEAEDAAEQARGIADELLGDL